MKYSISLLVVCLLTICEFRAQAQYDTEIDYGLRFKYGITRFSEIDKKEVESQGGTFDAYSLSTGMFLQIRVNHFYFQPELIYNMVKTNLGNEFGNNPDYSYAEYEFKFNSVELPLLLGYRTNFENSAIRFGAGPLFSYLMNVNGEVLLTERNGGSIENQPVDQEELDAFNEITLGARMGVGIDIGPFLIDVMYERVFSKVGEEIASITPVIAGKENSFLIGIGYKLLRVKR